MTNCEVSECDNFRSAICLHCHLHLCIPHIVAHGTLLLKEGDKLCEQINELSEQLNVYLQQIHRASDEAKDKLNVWRQNQIDQVQKEYAEKTQVIELRKNHLTDLENQLTQRLIDEAIKPLDYMQKRQNTSSENLQTIRQVIAEVARDSAQLDFGLKDPLSQRSSSSPVNTTITNQVSLSQLNSSDPQQLVNQPTSIGACTVSKNQTVSAKQTITSSSTTSKPTATTSVSAIPKTITATTVSASATSKPTVVTTNSASETAKPTATAAAATSKPTVVTTTSVSKTSKPTATAAAATSKPTVVTTVSKTSKSTAAAAASSTFPQPQSAASAISKTTINRPASAACSKLIELFLDVSGYSDTMVEFYIVKKFHRVVHVNNLMILLLSLLKAWHTPKSSTGIYDVLHHYIKMIKKYMQGSEHQLTVIAASQVFVTSCKYDEKTSSEMINALLQFFFTSQCITKETVLDWYKNGARYGYAGYEKVKQCAKPFIDQINANIKSK